MCRPKKIDINKLTDKELLDLFAVILAEESPSPLSVWKSLERKGRVKLIKTPDGTRIIPLG